MPREHTVNLRCSFCGKHQREVRKLIAGPTVYVCDECIKLCNEIIAEEAERGDLPPVEAAPRPKREREVDKSRQTLCCSFCGKHQREVRKLIAGPTVYICDECIGLCNDIIAEEIDREEHAAQLPGGVRARIAKILERGVPAAERIQNALKDRIIEETARRRAAGEPPDRRLWVPLALAFNWRDFHALLARATPEKSESGKGGPLEGELPGWVSPIAERLAGILEVLEDVLARSLEESGLEKLRQLGPSVDITVKKLLEAREMLLAGAPRSPEASG
jgi:hypothetical protein